MGQALLLGRSCRVVGEEYEGVVAYEALYGMMHVDPDIDAPLCAETQPGRAQLNRRERPWGLQTRDQVACGAHTANALHQGSVGLAGARDPSISSCRSSTSTGSPAVSTSAPAVVIRTSSSILTPHPARPSGRSRSSGGK